jgi:hypothetical protein
METIARDAGYFRAAMYRQFPNREHPVDALIRRTTQRHMVRITERQHVGAGPVMVRRCSPRAGFTSGGVRFARAGDTSIRLAGTSPVVDDDLRMPAAMPAFVPSASPTAFRGSFVRKRQRLRPPRWTSQRVTATEATTAPTSRMFVIRAIYREAGALRSKTLKFYCQRLGN